MNKFANLLVQEEGICPVQYILETAEDQRA